MDGGRLFPTIPAGTSLLCLSDRSPKTSGSRWKNFCGTDERVKRPELKWVSGAVLVFFVVIFFGWRFWMSVFAPGSTREETARILVHDLKLGFRAKQKAIEYGDSILPFLIAESANFKGLNGRNSFWISETLGSIQSEKSRGILLELYSRTNDIAKLTGAVGLAQQGVLPEAVAEGGYLIQTVRKDSGQTETQLAIIALGRSKNPAALACLLDVLRKRPSDYWYHAYAAEGLARIGSKDAVPILREYLQSPEFHALPEAFRALVSLGDRDAVPLAIARVSPELKGYNSGFVVRELERVTGRSYGYDPKAWNRWWQSAKVTWRIPQEFLKPWDEQKRLY